MVGPRAGRRTPLGEPESSRGGRRGTRKGRQIDAVYQESLRQEQERRAQEGSGGGSRTAATSTRTDSTRRRRQRTEGETGRGKEVTVEEPQRHEQDMEEQERQLAEDYLPPPDGMEEDDEEEVEGGEQEVTSKVYLRGPVSLPNDVPTASRPLLQPHGTGFKKLGPGRSVSHVLGALLKSHYPGLVSRGDGTPAVPAVRWLDYKLGADTTHGTKYEVVLQDFWQYFQCAEGQQELSRKILMTKAVKAVTDMLYEARVAAVVRIEATKGVVCERKNAIKKYPSAQEYNSAVPTWCAHHAEAWSQLSHMWDSDASKAKNAASRKNRLLVKSYHHQGSRSVSGYAEIYR